MSTAPKQLVIISGKGGTGKTSLAAAIAHLAAGELPIVIADADVDAANLDLVLHPTRLESHPFSNGLVAEINEEKCISCGLCEEACRFDAILVPDRTGDPYGIDEVACDGCAACVYHCPVEAITMREPQVGEWYISETPYGPLYHAHLFAGADNSGKLVTLVKQQAKLRAMDDGRPLVVVDGPPGIGCPVISAASGADLALIVVEPTLSGAHDLARVLELTDHFGVPALVAINKGDLSEQQSSAIEAFCRERGVALSVRIPYDTLVTEAMVAGQPITAYAESPAAQAIRALWATIKERLGLQGKE